MLNDKDLERYARQAIMPTIGEEGQEKLLAAQILIVGAGGLGAPVILYLAAAGIGAITIVDDDKISRSDLNRQIIYKDTDLGLSKSQKAADPRPSPWRRINGEWTYFRPWASPRL